MAKELTFSSATLGWRFAHTDIFLKNFIKQWELLQDVQIKNLDEYWNINVASGEWLKQLGAIFHVEKPQVLSGNAFILDIDMLDDESVFLDGTNEDIADDIFRKIIILRSISTRKLFSIKNIADNIYSAFGSDQVKVEIKENVDKQGNPKDRYFQLILTFKNQEMIKLFIGLQETFPLILIGKPMGVSYDIFVEYDPDLGENTYSVLTGPNNMWTTGAPTYSPSYYDGTDSSLVGHEGYCYSYQDGKYTMYIEKNTLIQTNSWTPVYVDKGLTTIAAYVNFLASEDYNLNIEGGISGLTGLNKYVYFPLNGETEADKHLCYISTWRRS